MIPYLINITAIWLLSLLVFDVFLRRETYHGYNRFYLLATFLLGILLPLLPRTLDSVIYRQAGYLPAKQIAVARQSLEGVVSQSTLSDYAVWMQIAYFAGAAIALLLLLADALKLFIYYNKGVRHHENGMTIVETGKSHTPFSFLHLVFVSGTVTYDADEWAIILAHEQQHARLGHLADVILLQLAKVVFWFHPLVYIYNNRLLAVHEYQADRTPSVKSANYAKFLIEQAMLHTAPVITHSFNRSPIKTRIVMLSRKSTRTARIKRLVFAPLLLSALVFCSQSVIAQKFKADENGIVKLSANKFGYSKPQTDTIQMEDPTTNEVVMKVVKTNSSIISIDGKIVEDAKPVFRNNGDPAKYLVTHMKKELSVLPDGFYHLGIMNVVVDEKGKTCAYTYRGVSGYKNETPRQVEAIKLDKATEQVLFNKICNELNNLPAWMPPAINGKKVPGVSNQFGDSWQPILQVKGHKLLLKTGKNWVAI